MEKEEDEKEKEEEEEEVRSPGQVIMTASTHLQHHKNKQLATLLPVSSQGRGYPVAGWRLAGGWQDSGGTGRKGTTTLAPPTCHWESNLQPPGGSCPGAVSPVAPPPHTPSLPTPRKG